MYVVPVKKVTVEALWMEDLFVVKVMTKYVIYNIEKSFELVSTQICAWSCLYRFVVSNRHESWLTDIDPSKLPARSYGLVVANRHGSWLMDTDPS